MGITDVRKARFLRGNGLFHPGDLLFLQGKIRSFHREDDFFRGGTAAFYLGDKKELQ